MRVSRASISAGERRARSSSVMGGGQRRLTTKASSMDISRARLERRPESSSSARRAMVTLPGREREISAFSPAREKSWTFSREWPLRFCAKTR